MRVVKRRLERPAANACGKEALQNARSKYREKRALGLRTQAANACSKEALK